MDAGRAPVGDGAGRAERIVHPRREIPDISAAATADNAIVISPFLREQELKIPMDVTIGTGEANFTSLDFYYGAKALEGTSEVVALVAHTILNRTLAKQVPSIEGIRANFKKSFVSSFGQRFELSITGAEQVRVLEWLGEDGFFELMKHYIGQAIGVDHPITKPVAVSWDRTYVEDEVDLIRRIREPLLRMHKPIENQGYRIVLNKRRSPISVLNNETLQYISQEETEDRRVEIAAVITRFNKLTGTGRLILSEVESSVSFAPAMTWKMFPTSQKKIFSQNLHRNNGVEDFLPITLEVTRILGRNDVVKHYKVHRVVLDE
ncbi:hypothetical protein [Pseudomonas viridiflava]|uniref:hypothetical protein n=1 Tax=Pseudomonas viridiflava TaxID=33069 RepID=UPI0013C2D96E|nr:hypothetical protein [Pseudomonas viridiflava]